jgi:hypothetical protein
MPLSKQLSGIEAQTWFYAAFNYMYRTWHHIQSHSGRQKIRTTRTKSSSCQRLIHGKSCHPGSRKYRQSRLALLARFLHRCSFRTMHCTPYRSGHRSIRTIRTASSSCRKQSWHMSFHRCRRRIHRSKRSHRRAGGWGWSRSHPRCGTSWPRARPCTRPW